MYQKGSNVEPKIDLTKSGNKLITNLLGPASKNVGKALGNITEVIEVATLPLKLMSQYLKVNIEMYSNKIKNIPIDKIRKVEPEIAIPIIEKLSYTSNEIIADIYTTLLAKASSIDTINLVHPGFINKINSMAPVEAQFLKYIEENNTLEIDYIVCKAEEEDDFEYISPKYTLISKELNVSPEMFEVYLDNLCSLSILEDCKDEYNTKTDIFKRIKDLYKEDITEIKEKVKEGYFKKKKFDFDKSYYKVTTLGKLFIKSCIVK